jgi:7-cyano-7-deazaguanine tRNA-ribosyltransferase
MQVVAGLSLKQLSPRVWDPSSPYFLPHVHAVMISYADFDKMAAARRKAMDIGLHTFLGVPDSTKIYLDNGAFYFLGRSGETPRAAYEEFVAHAKPDWWPIPQDFIPTANMPPEEQLRCFKQTMEMNLAYQHDGFTPVIHISHMLEQYTVAVQANECLAAKPTIALGGIVPNLLRASKALPYNDILTGLLHVRREFADKLLHVFGIGGTATMHIAVLTGINSADSSGWRNRAARGIIQLPGSGDRSVADLGKWRGRAPSPLEWEKLEACRCPTCRSSGIAGIRAGGTEGFCNRATHNLWTLLEEVRLIEAHLSVGAYNYWYQRHLDNTIYRPLIDQLVALHDCEH